MNLTYKGDEYIVGKLFATSLDVLGLVPYLKETDVVLSARNLLQLSIAPPHLEGLSLDLLQQLLGLTDSCSLLDSQHLLHLAALLLYGADHLGENPLALLHCCFCGVLWRGYKYSVLS